jgi:hypothetical protein
VANFRSPWERCTYGKKLFKGATKAPFLKIGVCQMTKNGQILKKLGFIPSKYNINKGKSSEKIANSSH